MTEPSKTLAPIPPQKHPLSLRSRLRRFRRNRFWLLLFLWLSAALPELILHAAASGNVRAFFNSGLILGPLFSLAPALVIFILCTAIPNPRLNHRISVGFSGLLFLLHAWELVCFREFGAYWSVRSLLSGTIHLSLSRMLSGLWNAMPLILPMGLPFLIFLALGRRLFSFRPLKSWRQHIPMAAFCVLVQMLSVGILPLFGTGDTSAYGLYHGTSQPDLSVSRLGLLTAFRLDLSRALTGADAIGAITPEQPPEHTDSSVTEPITAVALSTSPEANAIPLDFITLAQEESNEPIARIHRYFAARTPSLKNSKTGLFEGCNLIQITADSFFHSSVTQELTPVLHRMVHGGYLFTSYHIPQWSADDTDPEYALLTGTIPDGSGGSFEASIGNYMPLTLAQQLIRRGYSAWALHSCGQDPCARFPCLENLGYECLPSQAETATDLFDRTSHFYFSEEPFILFCSLEELQGMQELEQVLELLLSRMESAGVLEDTVILLTSSAAASDGTLGSCILWKPGLVPETIDDPIGPLDLLPTMSNLFGLEFDSRLYMGRDAFSNTQPLVVFGDRSWITDRAVYDAASGQATSLTATPVSEEYIASLCAEVNNRFTVSAGVVQYDYWRILLG